MRLQDLRSERGPNLARIAATVVWEDCDRPAQEIYYETPDEFGGDLTLNPHAFLVGSLMPAMRHGEGRIAIEAEICPELQNGLETAMGWLCHWYGPPRRQVRIEVRKRTRLPSPRTPDRAGSFLSGGVDSLATLRANRLDFPLDHPRSIRDCILVHGFDIGAVEGLRGEPDIFARALKLASEVAQDAQVTLVPIHTNIRHLDSDIEFWEYEFHGAAIASVAHAMSRRLTVVSIASTYDLFSLKPWGSHPLLDPNYGSADLLIRHDGLRLSRLKKVQLISGWEIALRNLRVCTENSLERPNCGRCEKCIRTMTELLAVGQLANTWAFPVRDVSKDLLDSIQIGNELEDSFYCDLVEPLRAIGRVDLVKVIEAKSAQFHKRLAWERERDWKGAVKRVDRRLVNGSLYSLYRAVRAGVTNISTLGRNRG